MATKNALPDRIAIVAGPGYWGFFVKGLAEGASVTFTLKYHNAVAVVKVELLGADAEANNDHRAWYVKCGPAACGVKQFGTYEQHLKRILEATTKKPFLVYFNVQNGHGHVREDGKR